MYPFARIGTTRYKFPAPPTVGAHGYFSGGSTSHGGSISGLSIENRSAVLVCVQINLSSYPGTISVTDNASPSSNTYTLISGPNSTAAGNYNLYLCDNISGSPTSVTVTLSSPQFVMVEVVEIRGVNNSSPYDKLLFTNAGTTSPFSTGNITTTKVNELLVALGGTPTNKYAVSSPTGTPSTGWMTIDVDEDAVNLQTIFSYYNTVLSVGTYSFEITADHNYSTGIYLISFVG